MKMILAFATTVAALSISGAHGASDPKAHLIRIPLTRSTEMKAGEYDQPITSYYAKVEVGTPAKKFKVLFDITSGESWLPHYSHFGLFLRRLHYGKGYCKADSSTSVKEAREYVFFYHGCELSGKAYEDQFTFNDVMESLQSPSFRQRFIAVSSASDDRLSDLPMDGVVSLKLSTHSESGTRSMLLSLQAAGLIRQLQFSLWLDGSIDGGELGGEITLGGQNPLRYLGTFSYHPVVSIKTDLWELKLQRVMLGGQIVSCQDRGCSAILSTSTNGLYGPQEDVQRIFTLLGLNAVSVGDKKYAVQEVDCLKAAEIPALSFSIDGYVYVVPATSFIRRKVDGLIFKSSTCFVDIFPLSASTHWILGTDFLSNYYSTYDLASRTVGFAARKHV